MATGVACWFGRPPSHPEVVILSPSSSDSITIAGICFTELTKSEHRRVDTSGQLPSDFGLNAGGTKGTKIIRPSPLLAIKPSR